MTYINEKITEIIKAKNNIAELKEILCEMYAVIQMDSSVRQEFDELSEIIYQNNKN